MTYPKHALLLLAALLQLAGCGTTYQPMEAQHHSNEELAMLDWNTAASPWHDQSDGCVLCVKAIDDVRHESLGEGTLYGGATRAELAPGLHRISYKTLRAGPWMMLFLAGVPSQAEAYCSYKGEPHPAFCEYTEIDMKAGHIYKLKSRKYEICGGAISLYAIWFEDQTTGKVVGESNPLDCESIFP